MGTEPDSIPALKAERERCVCTYSQKRLIAQEETQRALAEHRNREICDRAIARVKELGAKLAAAADECERHTKYHREVAPYATGKCLCDACRLADNVLAVIHDALEGC